jgi:hypothetical protein
MAVVKNDVDLLRLVPVTARRKARAALSFTTIPRAAMTISRRTADSAGRSRMSQERQKCRGISPLRLWSNPRTANSGASTARSRSRLRSRIRGQSMGAFPG